MPKGYEYRINGGTPVDVGDVLTIPVTGLSPSTEYDFEVRKRDDAGNYSAWSPVFTISTQASSSSVAFVGTEYAASFPYDTSPCTTSAFTPNAGSQLLVIAALLGPSDEGDWSDDLTISDSQTVPLTWAPLANDFITPSSYGGAQAYRVWLSSATAAESTTITVGSPSGQWRTSIVVAELTDAQASITGLVQDDTAPLSGGYTATLGVAPNANDASVFLRFGNNDGSGTYSMPGWTTVADLTTPGETILFVAIRTGSTSTSATLDTTRAFTSYGADAVFNILAA